MLAVATLLQITVLGLCNVLCCLSWAMRCAQLLVLGYAVCSIAGLLLCADEYIVAGFSFVQCVQLLGQYVIGCTVLGCQYDSRHW